MPGIISRHQSPMGREFRPSQATSPPRVVRFDSGALVTGVTRPMHGSEAWALYQFEKHAQRCGSCYRPYEVHKNGGQLCERGHSLAQGVASQLYMDRNRVVYSHSIEDEQLVRVEVPQGFEHSLQLLRAVERSRRHRRRGPFVSFDNSSYASPRFTSKPVFQTQTGAYHPSHYTYESFPSYEDQRAHRHHHRKYHHSTPKAHIVDWPDYEAAMPSRVRSNSDSSNSTLFGKGPYMVEVIEPTYPVNPPKRKEYRRSRFW
ncbi:MAG: hypothetical protein M1821_004024 [Bathelium mastoideum]|nr:MAG: hypothetical protein M1821_004024 [Bathelium mastoideum]